MMLITLFLLGMSVFFTFGKGSPNLFGSNVYLVKTDAFELIKAPSAIVAEKIAPADIREHDIVIFTLVNGHKAIGEVRGINASDETETAYKYFTLADETGEEHIVAEHLIVAKAMKASTTLGLMITFASSPAGLLIIAFIPCACVLVMEIVRPVLRKRREKEEIVPVNKQDEVPTYVPVSASNGVKPNSEAALRAYKKTKSDNYLSEAKEPQLYPQKIPLAKPKTKPAQTEPLSSAKLAEAIAAVNAERKTAPIPEIKPEEPVNSYTPKPTNKNIEDILAKYSRQKGS
ncbi:MAG: hypothetical protein FWD34_02970 [Oscillospiraceae bacterium]|nr:hypothetical protein [Oscillospiraceae bacterium]